MAQQVREVKSIAELGFISPDSIGNNSLRELMLKVIYRQHLIVELRYAQERVKCFLIAYDPRFRDEIYQDVSNPGRIFIVPGRMVTSLVVLPHVNFMKVVDQLKEWMDMVVTGETDKDDTG